MQPIDLFILTLATYLLTDALVNRALPFGVLAKLRDKTQWGILMCWYCAAFWAGIVVYLVWLVEPRLMYPVAAGGGAILWWRYTGANAI